MYYRGNQDQERVCDAGHFLITSVDLPATFQVIEASKEKPYLGLLLRPDQRAMTELMVNSQLPPPRGLGNKKYL